MPVSDEVSMFFGAKPEIFEKASVLRGNMTPAEKILWEKLKDRKLFKQKLRRQLPIDIFIVDFYCHLLRLVIEVDGDYHLEKNQHEYDIGRSGELENWGLKVIRYTNDEILTNLDSVVQKIQTEIKTRESEIYK